MDLGKAIRLHRIFSDPSGRLLSVAVDHFAGYPGTMTAGLHNLPKIGTTQGDLHDIGKNLVAMMLEGSGYEIVDLGVDVPADRFIQAIRDGANVVAMSALLTTTMTNMQVAIEAIKEAGLRDQVRIIVGGAPITKSYADEIGADGYAEDASSAVRLVKEVLAA